MPFASINPTNPRTNLWNFGDNCSAFGGIWKTQFFFESAILNFFFKKKKNLLLHSYSNSSQINGYQEWDEILMITLISSKNIGVYKIMRNTAWQVFYRFKKGEVVISKKKKNTLLVILLQFWPYALPVLSAVPSRLPHSFVPCCLVSRQEGLDVPGSLTGRGPLCIHLS